MPTSLFVHFEEGETGSGAVFFLVILLWLFAAARFWHVWANKLNFEKVASNGIHLKINNFEKVSFGTFFVAII